MQPAAPQQRWPTQSLPDLLMVDPAFGVFSSDIEPVWRGPGARPRNRDAFRPHVEPSEGSVDSGPAEGQELDEQRGRDPSGRPDPILVGLLDDTGQRQEVELPGSGFRPRRRTEAADVIAEQVECHVVDVPAGARRCPRPIRAPKTGQKLEELSPFPGQKRTHIDRRQVRGDVPTSHHGADDTEPQVRRGPISDKFVISAGIVARPDGPSSPRAGVVPPSGFEPLISTLKGSCPRPLDDGGAARTAV